MNSRRRCEVEGRFGPFWALVSQKSVRNLTEDNANKLRFHKSRCSYLARDSSSRPGFQRVEERVGTKPSDSFNPSRQELRPVLSTLFGACTIFAQSRGGPVDFLTILKSTESQMEDGRDQVISSSAAWVRFWEELYLDAETRPSLPEVDFTQRMVIVVAMGEEPTGNFDIRVTKLVLIKGVSKVLPLLKVLIEETRPKPSMR